MITQQLHNSSLAVSRHVAPVTAPRHGATTTAGRCNACGSDIRNGKTLPYSFSIRHGKLVPCEWILCDGCGSCVARLDSTEQSDATHHQTREHGRLTRFARYHETNRPMYRHVCDGLTRRCLAGGRVLDVGTSFGGFLIEARAAGFDGSGTDINPACVEHARSMGFETHKIASLTQFPSSGRQFDAVTILDVACYFADQPAELKKASELLRPGGWLVMRVTNKKWLIPVATLASKISKRLGRRLYRRALVDHAFIQAPSSLKRVLEDCGYRDVTIEPDTTHTLVPGVKMDSRAMYALGGLASKLGRRPLMVPGVFVWARLAVDADAR
jgi:2-polyprenyl-3-methyl-5-hydroxy-6-metoxy-1,4-benzoquinol methylase